MGTVGEADCKAGQGQGQGLVSFDYGELGARDLSADIARAFGPDGLGVCAVRGVPGFNEARRALLPLARKLGKLPSELLSSYERPEAHYCVGWSRGQEHFKGKPDISKGSFYANPIFDDPAEGDKAVQAKFPYTLSCSWPSEVPELEAAFKTMSRIIYETAKPILAQCDAIVKAKYPAHDRALFEKTFPRSRLVVGRLLHYYAGVEDSWCGWHNDSSVITGLVPAMWLDDMTGDELQSLDTTAGLYVQGRGGAIERVSVPKDVLLFQIGEAAQILSGGVLQATPHSVRGHISDPGALQVSRESFALFMEPQWDMAIGPPEGASYEDVLRGEEGDLIPPLSKRLNPDPQTGTVEFGKLLGDSFAEYYKHNNKT